MRLLHVTHQYLPAVGGSEKFFAEMSEELVERGHQVDVLTSRSKDVYTWKSELPACETIHGVRVIRGASMVRYRFIWHLLKFAHQRYPASRSKFYEALILFGNGPLVPRIPAYILRHAHEYDLVHIQTLPFAHFVYSYRAARAARLPVVVTPHIHVDHPEDFDLGAFDHVLQGADLVIAQSEREQPYLAAHGVPPGHVMIGGAGIRLQDLPPCDRAECRRRQNLPLDSYVVLFLGRKTAYKGLEPILQAAQHECLAGKAITVVSAGPETEHSLELQRKYQGMANWVNREFVDEAAKVDLLNACDVLILPSTGEAFGLVFLEAWAVGKPVIGARAGAIPWVIRDEVDGLLVDPADPGDIAHKINRLIENPEFARRLAQSGQEKVFQTYTVSKIADRIEAGYQRVLTQYPQIPSTASAS